MRLISGMVQEMSSVAQQLADPEYSSESRMDSREAAAVVKQTHPEIRIFDDDKSLRAGGTE